MRPIGMGALSLTGGFIFQGVLLIGDSSEIARCNGADIYCTNMHHREYRQRKSWMAMRHPEGSLRVSE